MGSFTLWYTCVALEIFNLHKDILIMGSVKMTANLGQMGSFHFSRLNFFLWCGIKCGLVTASSLVNGALCGGKKFAAKGVWFPNYSFLTFLLMCCLYSRALCARKSCLCN